MTVQEDLTQEIKDTVDGMTKEFNEAKGCITCEFSLQPKYLEAMHLYTYAKKSELVNGEWHIYMCETCVERHPAHPYHVCIKRIED